MDLHSTIENGAHVIAVDVDRIDASVAIRFKDAVRAATQDGPDRVVLDLSKVSFVDSSGLGAIVAAMKLLGDSRSLDLAGLTPEVSKVFRLTRMDTVFAIYDDAADATRRSAG